MIHEAIEQLHCGDRVKQALQEDFRKITYKGIIYVKQEKYNSVKKKIAREISNVYTVVNKNIGHRHVLTLKSNNTGHYMLMLVLKKIMKMKRKTSKE